MGTTVSHLCNTTSSDASQKSHDLEFIKKSQQHHAFLSAAFFSYNTYTHTWNNVKEREVCRGFLHGTHMVFASRPGRRKHGNTGLQLLH